MLIDISIHAPLGGVRLGNLYKLQQLAMISIHAPLGGVRRFNFIHL